MMVTGLAALLALVAMTQPLWWVQGATSGGAVDRSMYGWTDRVDQEWRNGTLITTRTTAYSSPNFTEVRIRDIATTTYAIGAMYALSLIALGAFEFGLRRRSVPRLAVFGVHLAVLAIGIAALVYSAVAIPPAARIYSDPVITGFWGQAVSGGETLSWGPGAAWWLWAASTALALLAFVASLLPQRARSGFKPT
jgi:hypothetical protein